MEMILLMNIPQKLKFPCKKLTKINLFNIFTKLYVIFYINLRYVY